MADLPKGAKVFNVIRQSMNEVYMNTLPTATSDNIQTLGNILFNNQYQPMLNEFVNTLVNRIALTIVENKSFNNPLAIFKKGSVPLGTDIQALYENPAVAEPYELTNTAMAKLLTITDPDTKVAYFRRNRQDLYPKTIAREALQGAFVSWDKFEDYITSITTSLYSGNYIDEFKYTKQLINSAVRENKIITQLIDEGTTAKETYEGLIKKVRSTYLKMTMPSTKYNAYTHFSGASGEVTTWTDKDRIVFITTADVIAETDVDVLASAFNMDKANFMGRVVIVDEFDNDGIYGVLCDESWLQIYDNLMRFDEFYNARTMAWNEYLHVWGTFALSPFANAVAFVTDKALESIKANGVSFGVDSLALSLSNIPSYEVLEMDIQPANSTDEIQYTTGGTAGVISVTKVDRKHVKIVPLKAGAATVTATINGKTATLNVTVTA